MQSILTNHPGVVFILQLWNHLPLAGKFFAFLVLLLLAVAGVGILMDSFKGEVRTRHFSGFRLVSSRQLSKQTVYRDKKRRDFQIMLGEIPVPEELEDKHFLIDGTTGSGKSTLIRQLLQRLRVRRGRAIVVDLNGDFSRKFLTASDRIFNPFDSRSLRWNPLSEVREIKDIDKLLLSMVPTGNTAEDENWRSFARDFLKDLMKRMFETGELRLDRLKYYAKAAGDKEIAAFLQGGSDPTRVLDNSMMSNTKTLLKHFVASLDYAAADSNFSIQDWVASGKGFIFVTPRENERRALMLLINTFMNLVIQEAQSPPLGKRYQPIALVVDELASFDINDLQAVLEKGRKFSLVVFAGIQHVAQLEQKYGELGAMVLMGNFSTKVIFNPGDEYTGKDMAEEIGNHVVEQLEISRSTSSKGGTTITKTWRILPEAPLVSSSDLRKLRPLYAYVKFNGDYHVAKTLVRY